VQTNLFIVISSPLFLPAVEIWTYIFPTPSYTLVSAGSDDTSDEVSCSIRPSRVLAAFCCLTMTSCCSAKAFFWLISCRTWVFLVLERPRSFLFLSTA
jgi:hypothetical protein